MRVIAIALLAAAACSRPAPPPEQGPFGPVQFRVLSEQQNASFCVEGPEFGVAENEDDWIDLIDRHTECQPAQEIELPAVDFRKEVAVAAWWRVEPCLGASIRTRTVQRRGPDVIVTAEEKPVPSGAVCAQARGGLESFIALRKGPLFSGRERIGFVLGGKLLARIPRSKD